MTNAEVDGTGEPTNALMAMLQASMAGGATGANAGGNQNQLLEALKAFQAGGANKSPSPSPPRAPTGVGAQSSAHGAKGGPAGDLAGWGNE